MKYAIKFTFVTKCLSSGAFSKNSLTFSEENTRDFFLLNPSDFFFKNAFKVKYLSMPKSPLTLRLVFNIQKMDQSIDAWYFSFNSKK